MALFKKAKRAFSSVVQAIVRNNQNLAISKYVNDFADALMPENHDFILSDHSYNSFKQFITLKFTDELMDLDNPNPESLTWVDFSRITAASAKASVNFSIRSSEEDKLKFIEAYAENIAVTNATKTSSLKVDVFNSQLTPMGFLLEIIAADSVRSLRKKLYEPTIIARSRNMLMRPERMDI